MWISVLTVCLKALASGPIALASKVQALALRVEALDLTTSLIGTLSNGAIFDDLE